MKVLLIDDSGTVLGMMKALLEQVGYQVEGAGDGTRGLEAVGTFEPDVVVCDLRMPGMSGLDVVRAIRDLSATLPVIIFTEQSEIPRAVEAMREGAHGYIVKGAPMDVLVSEIEAAHAQRLRMERKIQLDQDRIRQRMLEDD
ncbi:MAG: response regulator [Myxococcaceae bacterium]